MTAKSIDRLDTIARRILILVFAAFCLLCLSQGSGDDDKDEETTGFDVGWGYRL